MASVLLLPVAVVARAATADPPGGDSGPPAVTSASRNDQTGSPGKEAARVPPEVDSGRSNPLGVGLRTMGNRGTSFALLCAAELVLAVCTRHVDIEGTVTKGSHEFAGSAIGVGPTLSIGFFL